MIQIAVKVLFTGAHILLIALCGIENWRVSLAKIKSAAFMSNSRVFQTTYLMHLS